jgi:MarR family transcriptional regulator, transcriptional regulator for hemolysin
MNSLMKNINITSRCANQYRSDRLTDSGLNGCQYTYILNICRNPGISQDKLAHLIYINKSNVTRQLISLEENGYIERRASNTDKRVAEVYPTQKSLDILPKVLIVLHEWNELVTEDFTEAEKEIFLSLLERITNKAKSYADGIKKE